MIGWIVAAVLYVLGFVHFCGLGKTIAIHIGGLGKWVRMSRFRRRATTFIFAAGWPFWMIIDVVAPKSSQKVEKQ